MWSLYVLWTSLLCALDWMWHTPLALTSPPFLTFRPEETFCIISSLCLSVTPLCGLPVGGSHSWLHRHRNVSWRSEVSVTCRTAGSSQITALLLAGRSFNIQKQQFERRGEESFVSVSSVCLPLRRTKSLKWTCIISSDWRSHVHHSCLSRLTVSQLLVSGQKWMLDGLITTSSPCWPFIKTISCLLFTFSVLFYSLQ